MFSVRSFCLTAALAALSGACPASAQQESEEAARQGPHGAQARELGNAIHARSDDHAEAERLGAELARRTIQQAPDVDPATGLAQTMPGAPKAGARIDDDFVVFGYLQSESQVFHQRWHALTHVGSRFVGFDGAGNLTSTGAFTGRSSYLKAGGAAEAAGVKVILVLASFDDGPGGAIESVMTSAARRSNLASQLAALLAADSYSHGVSIDVEFSWGPAVRDGLTAFMAELRSRLLSVNPDYELSIYTNAIYSSNQWDFDADTGITPHVDYMLYSMYDWASGLSPRAISHFTNCLGSSRMHAYLNAGLPPEKLVPVVSAYSRSWTGVSTYGATGTSATSSGFTDGLFDVTLNSSIGLPPQNYVREAEAAWYTWNSGTPRVRTFEGLEGMEYKIRHALSMQDPSGRWSGRRLGGVGFWSLMWMAETSSIDPRTGGSVSRTRTYPHVYEMTHEIFTPPGTRSFTMEAFDGLDFRWRDPNESPDTRGDSDGDTSRTLAPSPSGSGNALRVNFDFEGGAGNRAIIAHEVLAAPAVPHLPDTNAVLGRVPTLTRLLARVYVPAALPDFQIRMLVLDGATQLESSAPTSLDRAGWHTLVWDLGDPLAVEAFATTEPAFFSGNSILESAGLGARDLGFYGFSLEGDAAGSGQVFIDDVRYERSDPGAKAYRINEFRYAESSEEFVEIYGPAGPLPSGLAVRTYASTNGAVLRQFSIAGTIPDAGNGYGFFVVGDPGVSGVSASAGFGAGLDDLSNGSPTGLQLINAASLHVYDSVVYEAFGGLGDLIRRETLGVTSNGWPWLGEFADGRDASGASYSAGRFPDGHDTRRNARDFSFQGASPGAPNGRRLTVPSTLDFETADAALGTTFGNVLRSSPSAGGLPASPGGGLAWRTVDLAGGGVIGRAGDAALGHSGGFAVSGDLYVPASAAPAQAVAVGVCGSQGSRFFPADSVARSSGYESGYWLIYENRPGVGLNDGRADHGSTWELVHATHDQMDGSPVEVLASLPNFVLGVSEGEWTRFSFTVDPGNRQGAELIVTLNGQTLFSGPLPENGPTSGAFQVGFRENHPGPPSASEGTWVDRLRFEDV